MADYTIYSKGIWERILEKYPTINELSTKLGIENNPERAKEIKKAYKHNFGIFELNDDERKLAIHLETAEFRESGFLRQVVSTGKFHLENGANDYVIAAFDLVLADFEDSFKEWYKEIRKRNMSENSSFEEFYEVFLEIIKLKLDYKVPYTKMFIHKLLENSAMPKEDSLEIKQYFLKENPDMLSEVKCELIE